MIISLLAGAVALLATPREEEPQIVVPLADVLVSYPGGSAEEVENLVAARLERLLYQIDGVEYVYSMSRPGQAVVTVRFFVGQDREASLIKLYNKIFQNVDQTTPGIAGWVVKPVEIDDVPVITATLYSDRTTRTTSTGWPRRWRRAAAHPGQLDHHHPRRAAARGASESGPGAAGRLRAVRAGTRRRADSCPTPSWPRDLRAGQRQRCGSRPVPSCKTCAR
jgi:hypothetical protein